MLRTLSLHRGRRVSGLRQINRGAVGIMQRDIFRSDGEHSINLTVKLLVCNIVIVMHDIVPCVKDALQDGFQKLISEIRSQRRSTVVEPLMVVQAFARHSDAASHGGAVRHEGRRFLAWLLGAIWGTSR